MHGAGAWLIAPPVDEARTIEPALCKLALRRRLRLRVQDADTFCPMCGSTMDSYGDHALTCPCNGERTVRHNAVRNVVYTEALQGNMSPEREKAGLLPARPPQDALERPSGLDEESAEEVRDRQRRGRRPADIYLPRGTNGSPMALDFACTSGLRADLLRGVVEDPYGVLASYETLKRNFQPPGDSESTDVQCTRQGFRFAPMVVEAHAGGWSKEARRVLDAIAKHVHAACNSDAEIASLRIAQRVSVTLHRENARAVLRRLSDTVDEEVSDMALADWAADMW